MQKSWVEKLHNAKGLPKIVKLDKKASARWGSRGGTREFSTMYIPCPMDVYAVMEKVPKGKLITISEIRQIFAKKHKTAISCPLTTGIFSFIAANAADEEDKKMPYWRTLKTGGEVNPKYPGGVEKQKKLLEDEGHKVITKGKRTIVADFEKALYEL